MLTRHCTDKRFDARFRWNLLQQIYELRQAGGNWATAWLRREREHGEEARHTA